MPLRPPSLMQSFGSRLTSRRAYSTSSISQTAAAVPEALPPRWLSDLNARIGKCLIFGCSPAQIAAAGTVVSALATEWRGLVAGSEGFLTGGRRGLEEQNVVWGEQDSFQHVNNVTYIRYAESSRVNWVTHFAVHAPTAMEKKAWAELMTPRSVGLILKSIKADFKFPLVYPDKVSVYHKLRYPPSSPQIPSGSLILDAIVLSHKHRRVAAKIEEDIVVYDYQAAVKSKVPPFMREVLEETYQLQEAEKARARLRIWELIRRVESLEKETWDRPDAVEDVGSPGDGSK